MAAENQRHYARASRFYRNALFRARQNGFRDHVAASLQNLSSVSLNRRKFRLAADYARRGLVEARRLRDRARHCELLFSLGSAERGLGDYDSAVRHLRTSLGLARGRFRLVVRAILVEKGKVHLARREIGAALICFREARRLSGRENDAITGEAFYGFARCAGYGGQSREARAMGTRAVELLRDRGLLRSFPGSVIRSLSPSWR